MTKNKDLLVQPKTTTQEDDRESGDKEDEGTPGHLVDRNGRVKQTNVHESCANDIARSRDPKQEDLCAC